MTEACLCLVTAPVKSHHIASSLKADHLLCDCESERLACTAVRRDLRTAMETSVGCWSLIDRDVIAVVDGEVQEAGTKILLKLVSVPSDLFVVRSVTC